jgi:hypothetical protein
MASCIGIDAAGVISGPDLLYFLKYQTDRYQIGTDLESSAMDVDREFSTTSNRKWRGVPMATEEPKRPWEQQLRDAATHLETDLKSVVKYINDEVVPEVRKNGSEALRAAAAELHKLATRMDDHARKAGTPPPPKDAPKP